MFFLYADFCLKMIIFLDNYCKQYLMTKSVEILYMWFANANQSCANVQINHMIASAFKNKNLILVTLWTRYDQMFCLFLLRKQK